MQVKRKSSPAGPVSNQLEALMPFIVSRPHYAYGKTVALLGDAFEWLNEIPECSIHAVVTDPPFGVKEYDPIQLDKMKNGNGGVWRIPPSFDGRSRSPLPRFTALSAEERRQVQDFFFKLGRTLLRVLLPGGHIFIASSAYLSVLVFHALHEAGLEFRGQVIRLVRTLRGGNRPKNAENEFPNVCTMPRGCFEPWGIFRKPLPPGWTVAKCLKTYKTGGLRRQPDGSPFEDVIHSERTPKRERQTAPHPSLKPQRFLRKLVYASLPLGEGVVLDPFMGSGSTLASAEAVGYCAIGIEINPEYFEMGRNAIPRLSELCFR